MQNQNQISNIKNYKSKIIIQNQINKNQINSVLNELNWNEMKCLKLKPTILQLMHH